MNNIYDTIIIGGGLAGLKTAFDLKKNKFNILVLEARNRFGGRTESIKIGNGWIDAGGQWLGANNPNTKQLCEELKLETYKQYYEGKTIFDIYDKEGNSIKSFDESKVDLKDIGLGYIIPVIKRLDDISKEVDFSRTSKENPLMESLEKLSVSNWLIVNGFGESIKFFNWFCQMSLASSSDDVSIAFLMKYVNSCGSIESIFLSGDCCAEDSRIIGGSTMMAYKMVSFIKNCKLNREVVSIDQISDSIDRLIKVTTSNGDIYFCTNVVSTVPPTLLRNVTFKPELPLEKQRLKNEMEMGSTIKIIVIYDSAFWREQGFNGKALSFNGPVYESFDNCTHDLSVKSIVGFINGKDELKHWYSKSKEERKSAVLYQFSKYWGPKALNPISYIERNWKEEKFSSGCYMGVCKPGSVLSECNDFFRQPHGKIHWAGTETSTQWYGHMEGAITSSKRVVKEIIRNSFNSKSKL
ncbi:hypothetical protein RB653_010469 [Dictyostelium firmibasis]|uniref:Amine oxidase n=1 Tax=Dictyostelium firmibasis TaxID=79012 RepID=A0AAN7TU09_9MYCE